MKIDIVADKKKKSMDLPDQLLKEKADPKLISHVFRAKKLAKKKPAHTKTRGERRGGGRKPWRQKGTGRARHGSIRSPIWRKGGVTFGPRKDESYSKKVNKKELNKTLRALISDFYNSNQLIIVDKWPADRKTKKWEQFIADLPMKEPGSILLMLALSDKSKKKYIRNLPYVTPVFVDNIDLIKLLNHDYLITDKKAVKKLSNNLITSDKGGKKRKKEKKKRKTISRINNNNGHKGIQFN